MAAITQWYLLAALVGLEGQGGPSRVPGQERLEGLGH